MSTHLQTGGACGSRSSQRTAPLEDPSTIDPLLQLEVIYRLHALRFGEEDEDTVGQPEKGPGPICSTALAVACYWACTLGYTVFLFIRIYDSELDDFEVKASAPTPSCRSPGRPPWLPQAVLTAEDRMRCGVPARAPASRRSSSAGCCQTAVGHSPG